MTNSDMDIPFRQYLDEKFADLNSRLDRMRSGTEAHREDHSDRLRELEVRTGVLETTRPTHTQLMAAAAASTTIGISLGTLIAMILF